MRIQHNVTALNAYRNYSNNTSAISSNLEKLSSGYRINRAGDDAAGLAVSQKMRLQIAGLDQAQKNAKSGISYVQTAEGALQEVHDMLERMYTLAEQSANGTYDEGTDRVQLQKEVNSLMEEIDRIGKTANFNGMGIFAEYAGNNSTSSTDSSLTLKAALDENNAAGINDATFTAATDADVSALKDKTIDVTSVVATADTLAANDTITVDISALEGYTATYEDVDGNSATLANDGKITVGTDAGNIAAGSDSLELTIADADGNTVGTLALDLSTIATGGTTTITLGEDTSAASSSSTGATYEDAETSKLADYGIESIDLSSITDLTADAKVTAEIDADGTDSTLKVTVGDTTYTYVAEGSSTDLSGKEIELADGDGNTIKVTLASGQNVFGTDAVTDGDNDVASAEIGTAKAASSSSGSTTTPGKVSFWVGAENIKDDGGTEVNKLTIETLNLSVGKIGAAYQWGNVGVDLTTSVKNDIDISDVDITTADKAMSFLSKIKDASDAVSDMRGTLGAMQNRLDHTINNLSVMEENMTDAESVIRDTDVAEEMMEYTKNSILVQSAQAMLAQANQLPQGVLQLLQ